MVVNTIVVMEIFYLFSVRYIHGTSLTWQGVLGTPAVLIAWRGGRPAARLHLCAGRCRAVFGTAPIALADGLVIIGIGVALLVVVEIEKRIVNRVFAARTKANAKTLTRASIECVSGAAESAPPIVREASPPRPRGRVARRR